MSGLILLIFNLAITSSWVGQESQRRSWGMTGPDPSPASLFRLYADYGRYIEATNLFLEYVEAFASMVSCNFCCGILTCLVLQLI